MQGRAVGVHADQPAWSPGADPGDHRGQARAVSSSTAGRAASPRAVATRCCRPPERSVTALFPAPSICTSPRKVCASSRACFRPTPQTVAAKATLSRPSAYRSVGRSRRDAKITKRLQNHIKGVPLSCLGGSPPFEHDEVPRDGGDFPGANCHQGVSFLFCHTSPPGPYSYRKARSQRGTGLAGKGRWGHVRRKFSKGAVSYGL